jgi:glycosyltransferase involved in cell wall biosynthesis
MPKVSICIPAYNQIEYLQRTLSSILIQSYTDYEVIITDDSPSPIVADLVKTFDFNGKLKYYRNGRSLGSPKNWNQCISKATGEYIKIMHHDDWFSTPSSLEKLVALLQSGDNGLAFCACNNITSNGINQYYHSIKEKEVEIIKTQPEFLFSANRIGAPSVTIFKRTSIAFDEKIKYLVDLEFYIRLLKLNPYFLYTTEALVNIGLNEGQVTNTAIGNKPLLIFEYSYTYQKLNFTKTTFKWCFIAFWNLFNQLNIQSVKELKNHGWYGDMPRFIKYIVIAKRIAVMAKKSKLQKAIKYLTLNYTKQLVNN